MGGGSERLFGTDGVRGRVGEGWMREDHLSALGRAVGEVVAGGAGGGARVLLGHDGRRSGPGLERALARGLAAAGLRPDSAGLITTPGLAHLTRTGDYSLGAMVSASHNPAGDNGVKVFGAEGDKLADEFELSIEERFFAEPAPVDEGPVPELSLAHEERYLEHLLRLADGLELSGLGVVVDCANGGGSRVAPRVLARLGARLHSIASDPDGENINRDCGSTHPEGLQEAVRLHGAEPWSTETGS